MLPYAIMACIGMALPLWCYFSFIIFNRDCHGLKKQQWCKSWLLTFPNWSSSYDSEGLVQVGIEHMWSAVCVYTMDSSWNPNSDRQELDQPQQDCTATCVTAQHYSSTTCILLCFHSCKKKCSMHSKNIIFLIEYVWNCATWKCVSWGVSVLSF